MNTVRAKPALKKKVLSPLNLTENNLQFGYKSDEGYYGPWGFIEAKYGFCHGMTIVTRQFAYLANFQSQRKLKDQYSYDKNPKAWLEYYEDVVDDIMAGKYTDIIGLKILVSSPSVPFKNILSDMQLNNGR